MRGDSSVLGITRDTVHELFRGTTAERIVRVGQTPVLMAKDPANEPYSRVLLATDNSPSAARALAAALALAPGAEFAPPPPPPVPLHHALDAEPLAVAQAAGRTAVAAAWDGRVRALLVVSDTIKPSSTRAIGRLRELGLRPVLLTGDNAATAKAVAAEVGIDEVIAEVLPSQKAQVVRRLQSEGRVVAMVGDGVNDAPALAQADLGLAIGTGTDVAIEASDLTLVSGDLGGVGDAIRLSRRTLETIKGNLFCAFDCNVAAQSHAPHGSRTPRVAEAARALSSVFVVSNSLRLRRFRRA